MSKIGYARVSIRSQNDDSQVDELTAYGCDRIFTDHGVSGKLASRPEFDAALAYLRAGDVLVITRLSRAMRSLHHLLDLVNGTRAENYQDGLKARDIGLVVIKQGIDTTTSQGRLIFHILGALDEFQRELIVDGTHEGLAAARARGRTGGRKPKLTDAQVKHARELYAAGDRTVADIAKLLGVSRQTVYRALEPVAIELPGRLVCTDRGQHAEARITSFAEPGEDGELQLQMTPAWDVIANTGPGSATTYRFTCRRCGRVVPLREQTLIARVNALRQAQGPGKRLTLDISL